MTGPKPFVDDTAVEEVGRRSDVTRRVPQKQLPTNVDLVINQSARAADGFLKTLGRSMGDADGLGAVIKREGLIDKVPVQLRGKITTGTPLTVDETTTIFTQLKSEPAIQEFLVKKIGYIPAADFEKVVIGLGIRDIVEPNVVYASHFLHARTKYIDDLVKLAGPIEGPKLREELTAELTRTSATGKVEIEKIMERVLPKMPGMEKEMRSISRAFEASKSIEPYLKEVERLVTEYAATITDPELKRLFDVKAYMDNMRRELEELIAIRAGIKSEAAMEKFMGRVEETLTRYANPRLGVLKSYMAQYEGTTRMLESLAGVFGQTTNAKEALAILEGRVRVKIERTWWQRKLDKVYRKPDDMRTIQRAMTKEGTELEEVTRTWWQRRPYLAGMIGVAAAGIVGYKYWWLPKARRQAEEAKMETRRAREREKEASAKLDITLSKVYETLRNLQGSADTKVRDMATANFNFLIDPKYRFVAIAIINDREFWMLANENPDALNRELAALREDVTLASNQREDPRDKSKVIIVGGIGAKFEIWGKDRLKDPTKEPKIPEEITTYHTASRISRRKAEIDKAPIIGDCPLTDPLFLGSGIILKNVEFMTQYPDIWYWYNMVAYKRLEMRFATREEYSAIRINGDIAELKSYIEGLPEPSKKRVLNTFRSHMIELVRPTERTESVLDLKGVLGKIGANDVLSIPRAAPEVTTIETTMTLSPEGKILFETNSGFSRKLDETITAALAGTTPSSELLKQVLASKFGGSEDKLREAVKADWEALIKLATTNSAKQSELAGNGVIVSVGDNGAVAVSLVPKKADDTIRSRLVQFAQKNK